MWTKTEMWWVVFWAQELYAPITPFLQSLDLGSLDSATLLELYTESVDRKVSSRDGNFSLAIAN